MGAHFAMDMLSSSQQIINYQTQSVFFIHESESTKLIHSVNNILTYWQFKNIGPQKFNQFHSM